MKNEAIELGVRRELFVDRAVIDALEGLSLRLHHPQPANVALRLDQPWEGLFSGSPTVIADGGKFRMFYFGFPLWPSKKHLRCLCMAESDDGVTFTRPTIGLHERDGSTNNNIVQPIDPETKRYVLMPFLDTRAGVPADERYKGVGGNYHGGGAFGWVSPDGIHWRCLDEQPITNLGPLDSENMGFWSEHEGCYVSYCRTWFKRDAHGRRGVLQRTADGADWEFVGKDESGKRWTLPLEGGLENDGMRWVSRCTSPDFREWSEPVELDAGDAPDEHIYTCLPKPYERAPHLYIAPGARFIRDRQVLSDEVAESVGLREQFRNKCTDVVLMSSRGGTAIDRTFLESWIRPGMDSADWIYGSTYPGNGFVQTGPTELSVYVTRHYTQPSIYVQRLTLRLDGFASLHGDYRGGEMATKLLRFSGNRLVMNYATSAAGSVRVGIEDEAGRAMDGFGLDDADERIGDTIEGVASWRGNTDVAAIAGRAVRLRFALRDADVFSYGFQSAT